MDGNDGHRPGGGGSAPRALVAVLGRRASAPPPADPPSPPNPPTPPDRPDRPDQPSPPDPPAAQPPSRIRPVLMIAAAVCVIAASLSVIGWIHWKVPSGGTYAVIETPPDALNGSPPAVRTSPQPLVPLLPPDRTPTRDPRPGASARRSAAPSAAATPRPSSRPVTGPAGAISGYLGKCLNVPGGNTAEGIPVEMAGCDANPGERWIMASDGTIQMAGKCVTAVGGQTADGTAVRLTTCDGTAGQQWRFTTGRDLVNPHADKCLDVKDFNPGDSAALQLWTCTGSANQKWAVPA